jgi:hypothetical protein
VTGLDGGLNRLGAEQRPYAEELGDALALTPGARQGRNGSPSGVTAPAS